MKTDIPTEWINGQKPHLIKDGIRVHLQYGELRSYCGSRLVKFVLWIFINFKDTFETGESFLIIFFSLIFLHLQQVKFTLENEKIGLKVTPLQCKCQIRMMIDQGDLMIPKPINPKKQIKKKPRKNGATLCILRSRSGCKNSGENLVDDEIPLQGGSHASSSHEVYLEPTTKRREDLGKHSVKTYFPKDRNCETC